LPAVYGVSAWLAQRSGWPQPNKSDVQRRRATVVSRQIALLRAHRLVRKIPGAHGDHLSGRVIAMALLVHP